MNTAQPIRKAEDLLRFRKYYRDQNPNKRNYLLIVAGLNTALRISDVLRLRWGDVYDFRKGICREHLFITEQKTEKDSLILINRNIREALEEYREYLSKIKKAPDEEQFLFESSKREGQPISRVQAFRIVKEAADACHLDGIISCHSLRKTFGYYAWKQGIQPALLMNIYNHSSFQVTIRYLGIEQDDRDQIFQQINL